MTRKRLEDDLSTILYWWNGLNRTLWRKSEVVREYSPENKQKIHDASNKIYEIKELLEKTFVEPLGKAMIEEIKCGVGRRRKK